MSPGYSAAWWIITFVVIVLIAVFWTSIPIPSRWVAVILVIILVVLGFVFFINWSKPYSAYVEPGKTVYYLSEEDVTAELNLSSVEIGLQNHTSGQTLGTLTMNIRDVSVTISNVEISTGVHNGKYLITLHNTSNNKVGINITPLPVDNKNLSYIGPLSSLPLA